MNCHIGTSNANEALLLRNIAQQIAERQWRPAGMISCFLLIRKHHCRYSCAPLVKQLN
jgi:hypothetical protein